MRKFKPLLIINLLLFVSTLTLFASQHYSVVITAIKVNGVVINKNDEMGFENIVISDKDAISFTYNLYTDGEKTTKPFLYNVNLKQGDAESPKTSGFTSVQYGPDLQEGEYQFGLSAFDLAGEWKTEMDYYTFKVNNFEAELIKSIVELQERVEIADSAIAKYKEAANAENKSWYSKFALPIEIGLTAFVLLTIALFIMTLLKYKKNLKEVKRFKEEVKVSQARFATLEEEIKANSQQEIDSLKNKMDLITKKFESITELNSNVANGVSTVQSTTNKLAELQTQKNGMFSDIVQGVSNPTNAIKGLVDLLRNYDFNAMETNDIVSNIIDTTQKIIDISEDIQRLAEFETSEPKLHPDLSDVHILIQNAINKNINDANKKNIEIKVNISPDVQPISIDPDKITIVLHNLINNAVKFTHENGSVSISAFYKNKSLFFEVTDTGVGIDQAGLLKIYRNMDADRTMTRMSADDTIGLLTVKKYVEAHNGKVIVSSMLGKGSTFSFFIPLTK
ncbi:MAG: HAMP domain-containing histidine kinase [Ignavibacteria bacterium]|jgi:signal transduction histidine kinase|nr:HAMP domain-containing histidine kinase [Ignavibacteria bacterium]